MGLVQEVELVRLARNVIFDVLNGDKNVDLFRIEIDLAKWVIENIWTPELEPTD